MAAAQTNGVNGHGPSSGLRSRTAAGDVSADEQSLLDRIGEALARLGRVKRVGLTVDDKDAFVKALNRKK
ncbi:hypothetical protein NQ176_g4810 [Zarea fungicola]|uniref:Uncharacterized protein n=1 Tax=Zarea fungicola TaxID=93591 RepID=A0ACC1NCI1_9HYPO|nr:hypothetical protein NQ176_g4810 [Lecanicillium fungicola]